MVFFCTICILIRQLRAIENEQLYRLLAVQVLGPLLEQKEYRRLITAFRARIGLAECQLTRKQPCKAG